MMATIRWMAPAPWDLEVPGRFVLAIEFSELGMERRKMQCQLQPKLRRSMI